MPSRSGSSAICALGSEEVFESVALSEADLQRNQQYLENRARESAEAQFQDYGAFLVSETERWGKAVKASGVRGD